MMIDKLHVAFNRLRYIPLLMTAICLLAVVPVHAQTQGQSTLAAEATASGVVEETIMPLESTTMPLEGTAAFDTTAISDDANKNDTGRNLDAADHTETATTVAVTLPHDLSSWGMFMAADWVVKAVMIGLVIASLLTWTALLSKTIELTALKRQLQHSLTQINAARTLTDAANANDKPGIGRELINVAQAELQLSADLLKKDEHSEGIKDGIKERVASSLSREEAASARRMKVGTGLLATIGAVAPFVGLFGTVWGIMNSFIGISQAQTTNLAVVAPGIAEALLATALGLVAAIPAVVIYNHFTRQIAGAKALVSDSAAGIMRLVSRDLDRGVKHVHST